MIKNLKVDTTFKSYDKLIIQYEKKAYHSDGQQYHQYQQS